MRYAPLVTALACAGCYFPAYYEEETVAPPRSADYGDPLSRPEVEKLLKAGVSDAVIVEKAKKSGALKLSADDIVALKQAGASDDLIKELIAMERRPSPPPSTVSTRTVYYSDYWWGSPSIYLGYSYWPHNHHSGCWPRWRSGVGVRVGW